jgi:two-component system cell cycle sensor histidine kinase PleC
MPLDPDIRAAEARVVFRTPLGLLTSAIICALSVVVLAPTVPGRFLLGWTSAFALCLGARLLLWLAWRANPPAAEDAHRWIKKFALGAGATGALWGALGAVILISDDPLQHAFVVMVLAGMAAGAVAALAPSPVALHAFLVPLGLELAAALAWHGGRPHLVMAAMVLAFLVLVGGIARELHSSFIGIIRLGLEKAKLADELRAARDAAEHANNAKSQILANMSHELRTPLNAIIGFAEVIRDALLEPVAARYRDYARNIHSSGHHLLGLINDVLDLAKIDTGRMDLHEEEVEVARLIADSLPLMAERARTGGVELVALPVPNLPPVWADRLRLKQVVLNLVSNAVKFTPRGGTVMVAALPTADGGLTIKVADTGIGMRAEEIPKALEPFRQVEQDLSRRFDGGGLGLPLAKQLVELHGGELTIASEPGQGTTVYVSLPVTRVIRAAA